jgi:hypothetical protein
MDGVPGRDKACSWLTATPTAITMAGRGEDDVEGAQGEADREVVDTQRRPR